MLMNCSFINFFQSIIHPSQTVLQRLLRIPRRISSLGISTVLALAIRPRGGRPKVSEEIRTLIRRMAVENVDWGAPKIHGELLRLGFTISESTVARYLRRLRP